MFLRTVETGLQDESIRAKRRPYLKDTSILDEDLMQLLNAAVSSESERSRKLKSQPNTNVKLSRQTSQVSGKKDNSEKVMAAIKDIRTEVESLHTEIKEAKTNDGARQRNQRVPRKPLCTSRQQSRQNSCIHCYICGADNHFAAGCRNRSVKPSLNG